MYLVYSYITNLFQSFFLFFHMIQEHASINSSSQHYGHISTMVQFLPPRQTTFQLAPPIVQNSFDVNSPIQPVHPNAFFYKQPMQMTFVIITSNVKKFHLN